jgi:hypothetical protein
LLLLVLVQAVQAQAPAPPGGWTFDRNTGCRVWDDRPSPGWSVTW